MGLRHLSHLLLGVCLLWSGCESRQRREVGNHFPNQPPTEAKAYQPPLALGSPVPVPATQQNSYQPPISLIRSNEYQSPLSPPQNPYPRSYQPPQIPVQGSQTYVLQNQQQHQHQSHSVQYIPPSGNLQQSYSVYQKPQLSSLPQPATSYSVQQQPPQVGPSAAILGDHPGVSHSTAERTYNVHPKGVESHVPAQAIHKAPASEISPDKSSGAKDKDNKNDEYVVYYYYYYDNDTSANNNLSLNFDDIPSLEGYDNDKLSKESEKSANARAPPANINLLTPGSDKSQTETGSPQARAVGDVYGRAERPSNAPLDASPVQNLKPVSNVFRYGSNEVPRFPVLPNFIVTEVQTTMRPVVSTPDSLTTHAPTTQSAQINAQPDLKTGDEADDDDLNSVLDHANDLKTFDEKTIAEEPTTTTTTTTTEATTTTEEPTTTTERPRRRPSLGGGGRRRFNQNPSASFSPNRNRQQQAPSRSTTTSSSTSSTSTTTTSTPTRRSFGSSNRIRPRPALGSNRPRPGTRTTEASEQDSKADSRAPEATTTSSTTVSSRSRFTSASASPRRFQSSRSRSLSTSSSTSTTSTTRAPSSSVSRSRPTSRPRPNPITRNRPPRPGFLRPRPGSEPEEPETTTVVPAPPTEEASPETVNEELPSTDDESNETDEEDETSEETDEPTTTESSRFSALFRPRNRNALGNRPRPVIGNRPSRT